MRRVFVTTALFCLLSSASAHAGNPWEDLMGPGKANLWTDPQARFYLDLPVGWKASPRKNLPLVEFHKTHPDHGVSARVSVEMRAVPPGVRVTHYAVHVQEEMKKLARGYQLHGKEKVTVSGQKAIRFHFTHQERGNVARQNEVVQTVFIVGERAFVITLETARGVQKVFWEDFEKMMKRFVGRAPGEEGMPMPKKRRRIRSGEMINPDAVRY